MTVDDSTLEKLDPIWEFAGEWAGPVLASVIAIIVGIIFIIINSGLFQNDQLAF